MPRSFSCARLSHFLGNFLVAGLAVIFFSRPAECARPSATLVKEINPGANGSDPANFVVLDGAAYFRADDGVHGFELWRSDGTPEDTALVLDLNPGPRNGFPDSLAALNGRLYFNGFDTTDFTGSKVWQSDGTATGTSLLADTFPDLEGGGTFGPPLPGGFAVLDKARVLFSALDPDGGLEPWITDGTSSGTSRILDLHPGPEWSVPIEFTKLRDFACFAADDSLVRNGDGTVTYNREVFRTDGTAAGTFRVKDINPGSDPSTPTDFLRLRNQIYFRADDGVHGTELWQTDGTEAGTFLVADLNPGKESSDPQELFQADFNDPTSGKNRLLLFQAYGAIHGVELFRSDGTAAGSSLLKDINLTGDSFPYGMTQFAGRSISPRTTEFTAASRG